MIRVLVAANSVIVRAGLEAIVSTSSALSVVGSATIETIDREIDALAPDVVLLAWDLEDDLNAILSTDDLGTIAIVLLVEELAGGIADLRQVRGILPTHASEREITVAIEAASAGLTVLHPGAIDALLPSLPVAPQPAPPTQSLTPREIEVLTMMAEGLANKSIARRLQISEHTVKFHIGSIFSKLNATSRTEAVMLGARQGLILL